MRRYVALFLSCLLLVLASCGRVLPSFLGIAGERAGEATSAAEGIEEPTTGERIYPGEEWTTAKPETLGVDAELLDTASRRIEENYPNIYSLLVVRSGVLVYEKYFQYQTKTDANPVYSVTKSVMSALTGIALEQGLIDSVDQKVSELLPEYFDGLEDPLKKEITLRHVLTMTGGLSSIDGNYYDYFTSGDWLSYALGLSMNEKPGEKFVYNTGLTHILSAVIEETSGQRVLAYAKENLFSKLGIQVRRWDSDAKNRNGGGTGLCMKPTDMARFGYLYLNSGVWNGEQVVPRQWVEESIQKHVAVSGDTDYGYLFWISDITDAGGRVHHTYQANGAGGQKILMVPDLDLVVVITADLNRQSLNSADTFDIIPQYILPAVDSLVQSTK